MTRALLALLIVSVTACAVQAPSQLTLTGGASERPADLSPAGVPVSSPAGHASDAPIVAGLSARVLRDRELCPGITVPPDILCHDTPVIHVGTVRLTVSTDRHPGRIAYMVRVGSTVVGESQHWTAPVGSRGTQLLVAPCPGCGDGASLHLGWPDETGAMAWAVNGIPVAGSPAPPGPEPEPEPQPDDGPRATVERRVGGWWVEVVEGLLRGEGFVPSTRSTPNVTQALKEGE